VTVSGGLATGGRLQAGGGAARRFATSFDFAQASKSMGKIANACSADQGFGVNRRKC